MEPTTQNPEREHRAEALQESISTSWCLEWWPLWVRVLTSVRLALAAHRRCLCSIDVLWPQVEQDAAALREHERHGQDILSCSEIEHDPKRRELWRALDGLACLSHPSSTEGMDDRVLSQVRASKRQDVLDAAQAFPWGELPEAAYVTAALSLCGQAIGV